jgi:hypothetical protein
LEGQTQPIANPSYPRRRSSVSNSTPRSNIRPRATQRSARRSRSARVEPSWPIPSERSRRRLTPPRRARTHPPLRETERLFALGR